MPRKKASTAEDTVRSVRHRTRKKYSEEEKIRIILEWLWGEESITKLCRREGISESFFYRWSKEFLKSGKQRLVGNTKRLANTEDVKDLRRENKQLKQLVAERALKNGVLKKGVLGLEN